MMQRTKTRRRSPPSAYTENRHLAAFIFFLIPVFADGQWNGATSSTDYSSLIYRDGNIKANSLYFGRYGSSIVSDPNPFMIASNPDAGNHDLLVFGNNDATLHLRLYDGNLKLGMSTAPNAILFNNGSAFFGNSVGIGVLNPSDQLQVNASGGGIIRLSNQQSSYLTSQSVITGQIRNIATQWNSNFTGINSNETTAIRFGYQADASGQVREASIRFYTQDDGSGNTNERMAILPGKINIGSEGGTLTGYGSALHFLGAQLNGDGLWLARHNTAENQTELRVNIGDDFGQNEDMFVVGTHHWNGGSWNPHLVVQASGNVGIGTTDTRGFKLAVKGKAVAEEIVVQVHSAWPDYVFHKYYQLPSLSEVEKFIIANSHLPDVPTAKEVQDNGLRIGEMNAILLKKIEELTLHLIQQDRVNKQQAAQIQVLMDALRSKEVHP